MEYGTFAGITWALETVVLGIALWKAIKTMGGKFVVLAAVS